MVKTKLKDLLDPNFQAGFHILSNTDKLPAVTLYRLGFQIEAIAEQIDRIEKTRTSLLNKYCEKNEDGLPIIGEDKNVKFAAKKMDEFLRELNEVLEEEVELPDPRVSISDVWPGILSEDKAQADAENTVKMPARAMRKIIGHLLSS